jgi:hypothetical protein
MLFLLIGFVIYNYCVVILDLVKWHDTIAIYSGGGDYLYLIDRLFLYK